MQKNLQKSKLSCNEIMEERDLYRDKIYMLETDIEALQNSCDEMKLKLDDYKEKEDNLRKRERTFYFIIQISRCFILDYEKH